MWDVIIVGGGPAGLSAGLILGRCLRKVLILDNGKPRNAFSQALHGYLTCDGISPMDFRRTSRQELAKYDVEFIDAEVTKATHMPDYFHITLQDGRTFESKKLLIATGVIDVVPAIDGIMDFYGKSVFICPYCDGWEVQKKPIAIYGRGDRGFKLAKTLTTWSEDIVLCTDGPSHLTPDQWKHLQNIGIEVIEKKIKGLKGEDGQLSGIIFSDHEVLARQAMFFNTESFIRSKLLEQLDCPFDQDEGVETHKYEKTEVPGLFVAGNICRDVQLVIIAAAEGAEAAFGINMELTQESINQRVTNQAGHHPQL